MRKPVFFIVGAPRCGTTAMCTYLKEHPKIFVPNRKEIHFLGNDQHKPGRTRDQEKHLRLFSAPKAESNESRGDLRVAFVLSSLDQRHQASS